MNFKTSAMLISCSCFLNSVQADPGDGSFAFVLDNDLFTGTDRHYTNGVRFGWLAETAEEEIPGLFGSAYSSWLRDRLDFLPYFGDANMKHNAAIALGQVIITPEDLSATEILPDDAPYAGFLYVGTSLYAWNDHRFRELDLSIGVLGPESGAQATQEFVHDILSSDQPMGWDNQIGTRYTASLSYTQGKRWLRKDYANGLGIDLTSDLSLVAGNLEVGATVGGILRLGRNLPRNFNAYFSGLISGGSESALLGLFDEQQSGWILYIGGFLNSVAYTVIDELIEDTHNLTIRNTTGQLYAGSSYQWPGFQLGLSIQKGTAATRENRDSELYGSVYFVWDI